MPEGRKGERSALVANLGVPLVISNGGMMRTSPYLVSLSLVAAIAALAARSAQPQQEPDLKPTITSGKQVALNVGISGSTFHSVNLSGSDFTDVDMSRTCMHDINLSDVSI